MEFDLCTFGARVEIIEMSVSSVILRDDEIESRLKIVSTPLMYPFQCQSNEIGDSERDSVNEETDRRKSPRARFYQLAPRHHAALISKLE